MYASPRDRADAILRKIDAGEVVTPGQYADICYHADRMPPRLAEWLWLQLEHRIGKEGVAYLQQWSRQSQPEVVTIAAR